MTTSNSTAPIISDFVSPAIDIAGVEQSLQPLKLGERVREIRKLKNLTLEEVSKQTGLARSTLSKIENDQMSPTFDVVQKLASGLAISMPQLFRPSRRRQTMGRRAITRKGEGRAHPTPTYEHELLCNALTNKLMIPFKSWIRARDFAEFGSWVRHDGEEFLYVLDGELIFYTEFYEPVTLAQGDSIYYDSGMGHVCVSTSEQDAEILWICTPS